MTWGELRNECLSLGFTKNKEYLKNKEAFYTAANWAQNQIALFVSPVLKKQVINHRGLQNVLTIGDDALKLRLYEGTAIVFKSLWAKAFCFQCDGNGICTVSDEEKTFDVVMKSDGEFKTYKGFCRGKTTLTFKGDHGYFIRNVSCYGITFSDKEEDIPLSGDYVGYDFKVIDKNFMSFADTSPVLEGDGKESYKVVADYKREGKSVIKLNGKHMGQYTVWYKVYPTAITSETPDDFILDLEEIPCQIIPYLMGFRLWLDDDVQRAVIYQNTAEDLIGKYLASTYEGKREPAYVDTEGALWLN